RSTHTLTHTHTHHTHTHTHTNTHTHTHTHTHSHRDTHTYTHTLMTHTHTQTQENMPAMQCKSINEWQYQFPSSLCSLTAEPPRRLRCFIGDITLLMAGLDPRQPPHCV